MPLLIVSLGIAVLLLLIIRWRFNAFIALILVALGVGVAMGMTPGQAIAAIQKGVGDTLGSLALILGFGAMLGAIIAESGAATVISRRLIEVFGTGKIAWAMVLTGFIIGVPMFFSVGFLVIIPIIYSVARETKLPLLYVGIPMVAALSVTHGFLPPHPAPTAIVQFFKADLNLTLLYGLVLSVPTIILAGVIFGKSFRKFDTALPEHLFPEKENTHERLPSFGISVFTALIPVLLMTLAGLTKLMFSQAQPVGAVFFHFTDLVWMGRQTVVEIFNFIGDPVISLLISVLMAAWTLGVWQGNSLGKVMDTLTNSVKPVAIIILLLGGGGAFKQVLVESGISQFIVDGMQGIQIPPLIMAWCIAAALRIALGSATVAALTAAGIVQPLVATGNVSPELLVLAVGAGSLTASQVNDTGFWLFKEYFNLNIIQTLKSWTVMETIISIVGLAGVLILDLII